MYGLAGYRHTPWMPYMCALDHNSAKRRADKGVAGPQTNRLKAGLGKKSSNHRHKEAKRAQADSQADW